MPKDPQKSDALTYAHRVWLRSLINTGDVALYRDAVAHMRATCSWAEMPTQDVFVLFRLAISRCPLEIGELSFSVGVTRAMGSKIIKRLGGGFGNVNGLGLLVDEEDTENWTRTLVSLTPAGIGAIDYVYSRVATAMRRQARDGNGDANRGNETA